MNRSRFGGRGKKRRGLEISHAEAKESRVLGAGEIFITPTSSAFSFNLLCSFAFQCGEM